MTRKGIKVTEGSSVAHSRAAALVACALLWLIGCGGEPCGGAEVEIRPAGSGGPSAFNSFECSGTMADFGLCKHPVRPRVEQSPCGGVELRFDATSPLLSVHFHVDADGLTAARAEIMYSKDDDGQSAATHIRGGWISAREVSANVENHQAGWLSLDVDGGQIIGMYDSWWPEVSEWYVLDKIALFAGPSLEQTHLARLGDNRLGDYLLRIPGMATAIESSPATHDALVAIGVSSPDLRMTGSLEGATRLLRDPDGLADNNFDGTGTLEPLTAAPPAVLGIGAIIGDGYQGGSPAADSNLILPILLSPDGASVALELNAGIVWSIVSETEWRGQIGGTLPLALVETTLRPALLKSFNETVANQCTPSCPPGSAGAWLLAQFDANADGELTSQELSDNADLEAALTPDFDLDGDGAPNTLSLAVSFSAVPVTVSAP